MKNGSNNSLERHKYETFIEALIECDLSDLWSSTSNRQRDLEEIRERGAREGVSFLTKTMPSLGKALDKALASDCPFTPPSGFKLGGDGFPLLLGDLFRSVFDANFVLLNEANIESVAGIRQICFMFYKLEAPYKSNENQKVLDGFVDTDAELPKYEGTWADSDPVLRRARGLISSVLGDLDPRCIIPCHGNGSVATGEDEREKSKFSRIYASVERCYPFTEFFRFSDSHTCDTQGELQELEAIDEPSARVALVPKDSRGPRIISMEPLEVQWLQQGLMHRLMPTIEKHPLTKGHVNFVNQEINRELAKSHSQDGDMVTLDMKDASDRVSLDAVKYLFGSTRILEGLLAARSTTTVLPSGQVVRLNKFAPMGSSVCFPVEALVFWSLLVSMLWTECGYRSRWDAARHIYVYGDDLVVPKEHWVKLKDRLEKHGLRVNADKCCIGSSFRESCGLDAFKGVDVSPLRIKTRLTGEPHMWLPSYVAYSNRAYAKGLVWLADKIEEEVNSLLAATFNYKKNKATYDQNLIPFSSEEIGVLSWVRPYGDLKQNNACGIKSRYNKRYQRYEVRGYQVELKKLTSMYGGYDELLRLSSRLFQDDILERHWMGCLEFSWKHPQEDDNDKVVYLAHPLFGKPSDKSVQQWIDANHQCARRNTYIDRRAVKLRKAWVPLY